jgi:DNA-binding LacI/PurR family transcriptional regulator
MLANAICRAVDVWPGSLRSLARAAGVAHSTLVRVRKGKFEGSDEVGVKVAVALEQAGAKCRHAAGQLRRSLKGR